MISQDRTRTGVKSKLSRMEFPGLVTTKMLRCLIPGGGNGAGDIRSDETIVGHISCRDVAGYWPMISSNTSYFYPRQNHLKSFVRQTACHCLDSFRKVLTAS